MFTIDFENGGTQILDSCLIGSRVVRYRILDVQILQLLVSAIELRDRTVNFLYGSKFVRFD